MANSVMQRFVLIPEEEYLALVKLKDRTLNEGRLNDNKNDGVKIMQGAGKANSNSNESLILPPPGIPVDNVERGEQGEEWVNYWQKL